MKVLDLFCGAGGAGMGYHLAGYEVIGVDKLYQENYPFEFHQADVMELDLEQLVAWEGFDVIHASPPCQSYSAATMHLSYGAPKLIEPLREVLLTLNVPYVIENVNGAPLYPDKTIMLCGSMFGKRIRRHRLFESNAGLVPHPFGCDHRGWVRQPRLEGEGREWLDEMEVKIWDRKMWMTQREARQAIPPYYTEYIGLQLKAAMERRVEKVA